MIFGLRTRRSTRSPADPAKFLASQSLPHERSTSSGEAGCGSCHDPHPSNPNFKYLRIGTNGGRNMGAFCAYCHEAMVDKNDM